MLGPKELTGGKYELTEYCGMGIIYPNGGNVFLS